MDDPTSDERLMLAYRAGDAAAFEALYRRHRGSLYRHLARQCGDPRLAEELYQDVWMRVIAARADYEPLARFTTWLYRIAHNRLIDHYRHHARDAAMLYDGDFDFDPDTFPAPAGNDPADRFVKADLGARLAGALAALPAPQREAFLLAEEGGLTLEEIAAATAAGRETVKSRLRYAVGKLRLSLRDLLP
jgi:RNA polymerase sigma-70 factor (ECF subfamily)